MEEQIKIRPANESDIPFLAIVARTAERGHRDFGIWDYIYTIERSLSFLEGWISEPNMFLHYSNFLVAYYEADGQPIAAALSYVYGNIKFDKWETLECSIASKQGWSYIEIELMKNRWNQIESCMPKYGNPDTLVLECVATVNPTFRRCGCQKKLLNELINRGLKENCSKVALSCLSDNITAQSVYQTFGFKVEDNRTSASFATALISPGLTVMSRILK